MENLIWLANAVFLKTNQSVKLKSDSFQCQWPFLNHANKSNLSVLILNFKTADLCFLFFIKNPELKGHYNKQLFKNKAVRLQRLKHYLFKSKVPIILTFYNKKSIWDFEYKVRLNLTWPHRGRTDDQWHGGRSRSGTSQKGLALQSWSGPPLTCKSNCKNSKNLSYKL